MNELALYNEIDDFACDWLENLIRGNHIAPGVVDRRSILDLTPDDLLRYRQVHLFAGIGIWSASLRDAGVRDDERWWSASCPCQPFSAAGQGIGFADERHLWPAAFHLIQQCRPPKIVGEQVASPDGLHWLDLVSADLEGADYAFGASDLCAAGVAISAGETGFGQKTIEWIRGAVQSCPDPFLAAELRDYAEWFSGQVGIGGPHIRQRLYWLADADCERCDGVDARIPRSGLSRNYAEATRRSATSLLADAAGGGQPMQRGAGEPWRERYVDGCVPASGVAHPPSNAERKSWVSGSSREQQEPFGGSSFFGFWGAANWIICTDGQARPVEVGTFPLAHGERSRVGKLRAYGNQICRPQATKFIIAGREAMTAHPGNAVASQQGKTT